jgi:hypothetical protein
MSTDPRLAFIGTYTDGDEDGVFGVQVAADGD